jgi:5-methylcytosine-specific restriction protein A
MKQLLEIKPSQSQRVMDLVNDAGVDVSDWVNFRDGPKPERSASNPKYCYEWAFIESGKVVVLNLWHEHMQERNGTIVHEANIRRFGVEMGTLGRHNLSMRATRLDLALQAAVRDRLPIRVIVLDGNIRDAEDPKSKASRVQNRLLDPRPWAVTTYDWMTGECTITRGAKPDRFVDQFDISEAQSEPEKRWSSGESYVRDLEVRRQVLERAEGKCEYCDQLGFVMSDGRIFLESHHVIPLSEGGADSVSNVAALCPNHHREAHYGKTCTKIRQVLLQKLKS